jgi:DNA-binding transcriptional MerR regulator
MQNKCEAEEQSHTFEKSGITGRSFLFFIKKLAHYVASRSIMISVRRCNMKNTEERSFSVGELARRAGVTVRTLQYYDKTGLLKSTLSCGGRRIYTRDDVLKLQQILFLKSFGFSLEEISDNILNSKSAADLGNVFTRQRELLLRQIGNLSEIVNMLDTVIAETKTGKEISLDKLMTIMELMKEGNPYTFVIRYFGDEQLNSIASRYDSTEESQPFLDQAKEVFTQLDLLYRKGADPAQKEGQELARRWWNMVTEFTAGDPAMLKSLLSAGKDIDNWPAETKDIHDAIEQFLSKALGVYFQNNGIQLPETEGFIND